jgi:hypothetical protein
MDSYAVLARRMNAKKKKMEARHKTVRTMRNCKNLLRATVESIGNGHSHARTWKAIITGPQIARTCKMSQLGQRGAREGLVQQLGHLLANCLGAVHFALRK